MNTTSEMQLVPIDKLIPYVNNARTHSPEQLNKLRSSLREFGFINPVIIDRDFNVIAGHGRILAAKAENISEVPCVFVDYLTPAQKKAYIIADNRMALDAGWDEEMLKVEIEALQADDFDLGLTGFDEKELAAFFDDDTDTKDDDFDVNAELEKPCITKPGLSNVNFSVEQGEYVAIMGESGSGKTTLLNILASLDRPTGGEVILNGKNTVDIKEKELSAFRRKNLGFVFQDFNLLDTFSLQDNIFLPLVLSGEKYDSMQEKLKPIAKELGIESILGKFPYEVSGGQKQRAAVARALITNPQIILADEPTGALDSKSTDQLLELFSKINGRGQTILMVTHSTKAASKAGRVLFIKDGEVFHQIYKASMTDEEMYTKISDTLTVLATGGESLE